MIKYREEAEKLELKETERIVILSVLKPVDDVRGYQKIAKSIVNEFDSSKKVTLIGFEKGFETGGKNDNFDRNLNINFIELFTSQNNNNRLGFWRFLTGFRIFNQLLKIRPTKVIVCTVELLPFSLLFKFLFTSKRNRIKLIYDVQENYAFNILYQDNYHIIAKKLLSFLIRSFEKLFSSFIDLYLLAERCYLEEMPFLRNTNYVFLENKFLFGDLEESNKAFYNFNYLKKKQIKFLIYGSFSKTYGTLEGISFFKELEKELQKNGFSARLTLAGYCSDKEYSKKIIKVIENESSTFLLNKCIDEPVTHKILLQQLQKTNFVILPYLLNKSIQNCIPTKFYECLAYEKPMLIFENLMWKNFVEPLNAGIFVEFVERENKREKTEEKERKMNNKEIRNKTIKNKKWGLQIQDWRAEDGEWIMENEIQAVVEKIIYGKFYTEPIDEKIWKFDREIIRNVI